MKCGSHELYVVSISLLASCLTVWPHAEAQPIVASEVLVAAHLRALGDELQILLQDNPQVRGFAKFG